MSALVRSGRLLLALFRTDAPRRRTLGVIRTSGAGALATSILLTACGGGGGNAGEGGNAGGGGNAGPLEIQALSNRADLISEGDALVEVILPPGASSSSLKVDVGGRDVSSAFAMRSNGRVTGVVSGLAAGPNVVSASADGARAAQLTLTNYPKGGPVFSGAQQLPLFCATPTAENATATSPATNVSGLSTRATDAQCNIATEFKFWYKSTAAGCTIEVPDPSPNTSNYQNTSVTTTTATASPTSCFKRYDPASPPTDVATTVTDAGATVPFIVRVERGTLNRGIYDIVVLFDPAKPWTPHAQQTQWNGKVYYPFGASSAQPRRQVRPPAWTSSNDSGGFTSNLTAISKGYMFVANSLSDAGNNTNKVLVAETVMMMKEHVIDNYGPVKFIIGTGSSGGAITTFSTLIADVIDGAIIGQHVSDETSRIEVNDCRALVETYAKPGWKSLMTGLTQAQMDVKQAAINGHVDARGCRSWYNSFGGVGRPGNFVSNTANLTTGELSVGTALNNNCQMPLGLVYDPITNPGGPRCSSWDWSSSIYGKTADGKRGLITLDNEGVQYGLKALLGGAIGAEEFVTLNELTGGADADSNPTESRTKSDLAALPVTYRSGIVFNGKKAAKLPLIDIRGNDNSGIHHIWRSFSAWERLDKEYGDHGNMAMWRYPPASTAVPGFASASLNSMSEWLTALTQDTAAGTIEAKVRRTRPTSAGDFCLLSSDPTQSIRVTHRATCDADPGLTIGASPRQIAGGPLSENVIKCQLRPVNEADYAGKLNATQLAQLRARFDTGVCDWTKPGVGQQDPATPMTYAQGAGGQPLGPAPVSAAK